MEQELFKVRAKVNNDIALKVLPGHFATTQSHITKYLDMTTMKTRCREAEQVAKAFSLDYAVSIPVDTIVCMDGLEVVGAFLAEELTRAGVHSMNAHKTMYIVSPEFNNSGQMMFRDNLQPMIAGKNVILLLGSITTGKTLRTCVESIRYYGGTLQGISAVFSAVNKIGNMDIFHIFSKSDIPEYQYYKMEDCPMCKAKQKIDALVNSYGYSKI